MSGLVTVAQSTAPADTITLHDARSDFPAMTEATRPPGPLPVPPSTSIASKPPTTGAGRSDPDHWRERRPQEVALREEDVDIPDVASHHALDGELPGAGETV